MRIKNTAFALHVTVNGSSNTDWGTDIGQRGKHTFTQPGFPEIVNAMVYYKIDDVENIKVILGKGNRTPLPFSEYSENNRLVLASCFDKVYLNGKELEGERFIMYILQEINKLTSNGDPNTHYRRCTLKFSNSLLYCDEPVNQHCIDAISRCFGQSLDGSWAILEMTIENEDELHFYGFPLGDVPKNYTSTLERNYDYEQRILKVERPLKESGVILNLPSVDSFEYPYMSAMRTKPFLLLAGISGTGKSRIVKQLAYMSCPDYGGLRDSEVAPGNYCMIEVKPNWHDSTELLGYESMINNRYVMTPFVQFLIKAMRFPNVPFFVCLDEMNLAPVEQYFAEFLSVLESRKRLNDGRIVSEPLIKAEIFNKYGETKLEQNKPMGLFDEIKKFQGESIQKEEVSDENIRSWDEVICQLRREGLCIPQNVIVVGTVNMDETTHQFSRKVIDRAMTIEMNIGEDKEKYFEDFFESNVSLGYYENEMPKEMFLSSYTSAMEAMEDNEGDAEEIKSIVPELLAELNECLKNTPFEVAYRVQNELIIYICELRREYADKSIEELVVMAMDDILMMKVLPRIEGDDLMLDNPLKELMKFCTMHNYQQAEKKINDMQTRLTSHFTSYWP